MAKQALTLLIQKCAMGPAHLAKHLGYLRRCYKVPGTTKYIPVHIETMGWICQHFLPGLKKVRGPNSWKHNVQQHKYKSFVARRGQYSQVLPKVISTGTLLYSTQGSNDVARAQQLYSWPQVSFQGKDSN